jgi:hypothetical protein
MDACPSTVVIRTATAHDEADLVRLAALDSAAAPAGRVLLAEVDGDVHAAVEVASGRVVADPFRPTADLADVLRLRASRMTASLQTRAAVRGPPHPPPATEPLRHVTPGRRPGSAGRTCSWQVWSALGSCTSSGARPTWRSASWSRRCRPCSGRGCASPGGRDHARALAALGHSIRVTRAELVGAGLVGLACASAATGW